MTLESTLTAGRQQAESLMTDTCTITRGAASPVLNESTGKYDTPGSTVYSGKCRVRSAGNVGSQGRDAGDAFAIVARPTISVPVGSASFVTGDLVTLTDAPLNPQLVGARFKVLSVSDQSQPTALRLECEEA